MAIINCPKCITIVSEADYNCPHCNFQLKTPPPQPSPVKSEGLGFFPSLIIALSYTAFVCYLLKLWLFPADKGPVYEDLTPSPSYKNEVRVINSGWDGSVVQVTRYLKNNLKDPDSFEAIQWGEVVRDNNQYFVRCKYRAKNSFGGYVISDQIFVISSNGVVLSVVPNKQ